MTEYSKQSDIAKAAATAAAQAASAAVECAEDRKYMDDVAVMDAACVCADTAEELAKQTRERLQQLQTLARGNWKSGRAIDVTEASRVSDLARAALDAAVAASYWASEVVINACSERD